jgi:hypothetical protein
MADKNEDNEINKSQLSQVEAQQSQQIDEQRLQARTRVDLNRQQMRKLALDNLALIERNTLLLREKLMGPDLKDEELMSLHDLINQHLSSVEQIKE